MSDCVSVVEVLLVVDNEVTVEGVAVVVDAAPEPTLQPDRPASRLCEWRSEGGEASRRCFLLFAVRCDAHLV